MADPSVAKGENPEILKVPCPKCHARYTVKKASIPKYPAAFACKKCGQRITIADTPPPVQTPPASPPLNDHAASKAGPVVDAQAGASMVNAPAEVPSPDEDLAIFIGEQAPLYLRRFMNFTVYGKPGFVATWHWPAFLVPGLWFLYRKLYLWSLLALVVNFIPLVNLAARIGWGISAQYIYYRHARRKIDRLRMLASSRPGMSLEPALRQKGGVHHWVWGFSAVPVIGILAAIAIPQFAAYRSRAYDNQARVAIEQVIGAQQAYRQANPQYADSLEQLRLTGAHLEHRQDLSVAILGAGPEDFYAEAFHPKGTKRFAAGAADPQAFILPVSVQEVFDPEKTYSLKTPEDWRKARDLNDEADLQMAQLVQDCYVIVIAEARADLEGTDLADYAGLARSMIEENLLQVQTNKTGLESINHCAAEQYVIRGTLPQDRLRIVYLHTVILGRDNFFQVLAWTTEQNYPAQEKTLRSIVNTFKEI